MPLAMVIGDSSVVGGEQIGEQVVDGKRGNELARLSNRFDRIVSTTVSRMNSDGQLLFPVAIPRRRTDHT